MFREFKTYALVKLRHCEKATKFEKISLLLWHLLSKSAALSKQEGDFCKFLWPFQKNWTLILYLITKVWWSQAQSVWQICTIISNGGRSENLGGAGTIWPHLRVRGEGAKRTCCISSKISMVLPKVNGLNPVKLKNIYTSQSAQPIRPSWSEIGFND